VRRLILDNPQTVIQELERIGVDHDAFSLFVNKAHSTIIKFENLSCAQANVLKQIALICGADAAIPKTAYRGSARRKMSALLFANLREIEKIRQRMKEQPWIKSLSQQLDAMLQDGKAPHLLLRKKKITFTRTFIMGVINVTPDSFYDGSRYATKEVVLQTASTMQEQGADIIDIGAESSRPGSAAISSREELRRLKPVLPPLAKKLNIPVSIDTQKSTVAQFAIDHGASLVNDISGLRADKKMVRLVAKHKVAVVLMHIKGTPKNMQIKPHYADLMAEMHEYFTKKIDFVLHHGVDEERIVIDPGLGFGKRLDDNYDIIKRLKELTIFRRPILVGHSRKSFVGKPFNLRPEQRLEGTLALEALLIHNGASILRVHDVGEAKKAALLVDRMHV
jgi:dihydropteroate synthase